ncbi:MAG: YggS family pyridoxal phosphate-dependent enzyme [Thioalkalivibrionaceae bacterium]
MSDTAQRLTALQNRIHHAAKRAGRDPTELTLIAVTKHHPIAAIQRLSGLGHKHFAENYPQEFVDKHDSLAKVDAALRWHFIGQIQRNKTRAIAERADVVHSLDRLIIAERLSDQRPEDRDPLDVLLQVDLSDETGKGGVKPSEAAMLATAVAELPRLRLRGLMAVPAPNNGLPDSPQARAVFARLRDLRDQIRDQIGHRIGRSSLRDSPHDPDRLAKNVQADTAPDRSQDLSSPGSEHRMPMLTWLSMGMSDDLEAAVLEGATHLRIGTALLGPRPKT